MLCLCCSVQAHHGAITTLTCTTSYILSLGEDDKLCVWERFQGHLLNTLQMVCNGDGLPVMLSPVMGLANRCKSVLISASCHVKSVVMTVTKHQDIVLMAKLSSIVT